MRKNNDIILRGVDAQEFHNRMMTIDMDNIESRDKYLSDIKWWFDDTDVLSIDASDMDIDLSVLERAEGIIEVITVSKDEEYVGSVDVRYSSSESGGARYCGAMEELDPPENCYASNDLCFGSPDMLIKFAA